MLNVLTGVFVSRAAEINVLDKDLIIQSAVSSKKSLVKELRDMFGEIDKTQCGSIGIDQLTEYMSRADVQAYLTAQQLHNGNFKQMISLLDPQKTGKVTRDEFIAGCLRYKGQALTLDVAVLLNEQQRQSRILEILVETLDRSGKQSFQDQQSRLLLAGVEGKQPLTQMSTSESIQTSASCGSAFHRPMPREEIRTETKPSHKLSYPNIDEAEGEVHNVANFVHTRSRSSLMKL